MSLFTEWHTIPIAAATIATIISRTETKQVFIIYRPYPMQQRLAGIVQHLRTSCHPAVVHHNLQCIKLLTPCATHCLYLILCQTAFFLLL